MSFPFRTLAAAALLAASMTQALAQDTYRARPVRIVVGASAGGVTDVIARFFGEFFAKQTGGQVVVENVTGAGGNVAFAQIAKAEPDGYTLGLAAAGNIVINPAVYKNLRFDPVADLVPVAPIGAASQVVVVNRDVPAKTFGELLALAKAKPGTLNYGSAGVGTTNHIAGALLAKQAGVDLVHVPYRGIAPAVTDLVGGRIQLMSVAVAPVIGFVRDGSVRPLAVATKERLKDLPEVPTAVEAGLPGYGAGADLFAFAATGETPPGFARDTIADFVRGSDRVDVRNIDARSDLAGNQAFAFRGGAGFTGAGGELTYGQGGGATILAGDVNGDAVADFQIELTGLVNLVAGDILL